ncbi:MAG: glycosyltransferase family 39 protein [Paludisphaera borealis]|uniref:ArnT family glycosyltransferase n=1 Tax=Paludisphaera borealis TaxID=1387353 RepID=UPI00284AA3E0|nr:glycosyltransferase family 39 protein [Paludisphaera borealis]MDR3618798.1 glycosyltransferase family 39 protein [Paludisphaera borealis]
MASRRWFIVIVGFSAILHAVAIYRTLVPAQDGLKFLRVARDFQSKPWADVIRGSDQHPLYPALIAAVEPPLSVVMGSGPETWRIAAQGVSALASLILLFPLYRLARSLFDERIGLIAVLIYVLLPIPAEVGRDTLGNALGLCCMTLSLWLGARAIREAAWLPALGSGLVGGVGFLARPEVILAPVAIGLAWAIHAARGRSIRSLITTPALPALGVGALVCVGAYALVKGEVSEKLAIRYGASIGSQKIMHRATPQLLPEGLDGAKLDFSPKEESDRSTMRGPVKTLVWIGRQWWDELCWGFAVMAIWGLTRQRFILSLRGDRDERDSGTVERLVIGVFVAVYLAVLVRHGTALGYLSSRHLLPLVVVSVVWAAAGTFVCLHRLGGKLTIRPETKRLALITASTFVVGVMVVYQLRTSHQSRWGHWAAGRWLAENAQAGQEVLDTRGWARFVSDNAGGYDYWHVRQALSDQRLSYVVVGHDELEVESPRSRTLGALLAFAATPIQDFPVRIGGRNVGARIYRFQQPASWEGFSP